MELIYCVEDDTSIRDIEIYTLRSTGYEATGFENGKAFFEAIRTRMPDLVILDIMLPDISGMEILTRLKKDPATLHLPVILASAKGTEFDKISGLDTGADDYLAKPFGMMEMVSRIKAVLRRSGKGGKDTLASGGIMVDTGAHEVTAGGEPVVLTLKEYELLCCLMKNPETVFTRDDLLTRVWGISSYSETRTVDAHIKTLRQKLGEKGALIETVRGVGYKFHEQNDI